MIRILKRARLPNRIWTLDILFAQNNINRINSSKIILAVIQITILEASQKIRTIYSFVLRFISFNFSIYFLEIFRKFSFRDVPESRQVKGRINLEIYFFQKNLNFPKF